MKEKIYCNQCGKEILTENGILKEDVFEGKKQWGYFSKKDMELHRFYLCESCYEKIVSGFSIPVEVSAVTEAL